MSATAFQRKRREEAAKLEEAALTQDDNVEMTVKQIKAILDEKGIKYDAKMKKSDLIVLLEEIEPPKNPMEEPPEDTGENEDENENDNGIQNEDAE